MKKGITLLIINVLLGFSLSLQAAPVSFTLYQQGYDEGAFVTISFTGDDLDNDGQLAAPSFGADVISAFTMTFSGNSQVPSFSLGLPDLFGLVYDLDGGPLGDGQLLAVEGVGANDGTFVYEAGPGPEAVCGIGNDCAFVSDGINQDFSQLLLVATPPTPASIPTLSEWSLIFLVFLLGLIGLKSPIIKRKF